VGEEFSSEAGEHVRAGERHEEAARPVEAAECYLRGGAYRDAARIMAHLGWFYEAGLTLLLPLPPGVIHVSELEPDTRQMCLDASVYFARGGARPEMVALLSALGENARAASLLMRAGLRARAAAIMRGDHLRESPWRPGMIGPLASHQGVMRRLQTLALQRDPDYQIVYPMPDGPQRRQERAPAEPPPPTPPPVETSGLFAMGLGDELGEEIARISGQHALPDLESLPEPELDSLDSLDSLADLDDIPVSEPTSFDGYETVEPLEREPPGEEAPGEWEEDSSGVFWHPDSQPITPLPGDIDANDADSLFIKPGTVMRDRYRIEAAIGAGGMATVFEAWDLELDEPVALKVFLSVVANQTLLRRFRREMKIHRRLRHPNIVRTHEFGIWRGARYISMELLKGQELWEYVGDKSPSLAEIVRLLIQACDGLGYAHAQGIVHRDIKPSNLFVTHEDGLKLMDFGIARALDSSRISFTGVRLGTPRYMSPEQIQAGGNVGPAADLYSLGAVMFEVLTGQPVFGDEELLPLLLNHLTQPPPIPSSLQDDIPPELDAICLKLLEKEPGDRYGSCEEVRYELASLLGE